MTNLNSVKDFENVYVSELEVMPPEYIDGVNTVKVRFYAFDGEERIDYGPYIYCRRDTLEGIGIYTTLLMSLLLKKKVHLKSTAETPYILGVVIDDHPE